MKNSDNLILEKRILWQNLFMYYLYYLYTPVENAEQFAADHLALL